MRKLIVFTSTVLLLLASAATMAGGRYQLTADKGYLVGGDGTTGNSFRYDGSEIWAGPGQAVINVDDKKNTDLVMGSVMTHGHTYTIVLNHFDGHGKAFMDGGIAHDLYIHGTTGHGPPVLPKVYTYLAGWGHANVYKDGVLLYKDYHAHFMLTQGTRDKTTHKVAFAGPKKLMMAKKSGNKKAMMAAKREIIAAEKHINYRTMQLHVVAHSAKKNKRHFPPFEEFIHFMWDEITWN